MPFIIAFLSNRISRTIIFYFSNANSLYKREFKQTQNIIKEEFTSDTSKTLSKEQSFYVESEIIKVAYNEFKKCYNETFYAKSDSSELDEMRRRETLFLFAFFSELWVIIILVLSFIFYKKITFIVFLFSKENAVDIYYFLTTILVLLIIPLILIIFIEIKYIREDLLNVLPLLFISKSSRKDAIKIAIENRIESINTENSIVKDIQIEALKPEIISVERMEYLVFVQK